MERRDFIKNLSLATAAPIFLNGIPINLWAQSSALQAAASTANNDRVLVLVQLHGGNDGLNTIVPLNQFSEYYNLRPNIALSQTGNRKVITLDSTLSDKQNVGLHPDMVGLKQLYDQGKATIIQGVTYKNSNQSHFRSRDIWYMGGSYNENLEAGWAGRFLDKEYPNYPQNYPSTDMPDPLALEIGSAVSLMYHRNNGIPVAISINNPEQFYNLIQEVGNSALPSALESTYYGQELRWIMEIEKKSDPYASQLKKIFDKGSNSTSVYPTLYNLNAPNKFLKNPLAPQLKLVARLLAGGIKTKIFLVKLGGFDTHAEQVESYNASFGNHSALLFHLSSALKAFQDDLKLLGVEDRVLTATFSEFGRRPESNGSYGSDHGSAAPMIIVGKHVKPGIINNNPDLNNLESGNLRMQTDYRQIYHTVLEDWLKASPEALKATGFDAYEKVDFINNALTSSKTAFVAERFSVSDAVPNPAFDFTNFVIQSPLDTNVKIDIYNSDGILIKTTFDGKLQTGKNTIKLEISDISAGLYQIVFNFKDTKITKKVIKKIL